MIYSYTTFKTDGPNGTTITFQQYEDFETHYIGNIGDVEFVYIEDGADLSVQPSEINLGAVTLTSEQKATLKNQTFTKFKKQILREHLEESAGDIYDMLADCMKMAEFSLMLTSRLAADYFGTEELTEEKRQEYSQRNQAFLDAVNSGSVTVRGDIDDPNEVLFRIMGRYSAVQNQVEKEYLSEMKKIGLH